MYGKSEQSVHVRYFQVCQPIVSTTSFSPVIPWVCELHVLAVPGSLVAAALVDLYPGVKEEYTVKQSIFHVTILNSS